MLWIPIQTLRMELRVEVADDDPILAGLCLAARSFIEQVTGRSIDVATAHTYAKDFSRPVLLPYSPLVSITSVTYTNTLGTANQTLASAHYRTSYLDGPLPMLEFLETVPEAAAPGTVDITVTHGYVSVPWDLIRCGVALVGLWYANPEGAAPVRLDDVPFSVRTILDLYRIKVPTR